MKFIKSLIKKLVKEDYPGYEETGISRSRWDQLSPSEKEKIRRVCT